MTVEYGNLEIEILDGQNLNSANYGLEYPSALGVQSEYQPSSKHGIRITENGIEKCSALLLESGGATGISENSFLIKNKRIYICCSDHIYSLKISDLSVNWRKQFDTATCFGIYEFQSDFLVHGELQISRIDESGHEKWTFGARDIFVNPNGKDEFKIKGDQIELTDWDNNKYVLNADGIEL
ncbi:hypothetical protein SAMN04488009_2268 [Maribacter sedimenticola]|uniref:Uncharacterized protein n=1 Tax=Maribacter sedimenticola TaxID=228956 RepID=A0ABY1SI49_9FLAO|nr:hypothetical protein [Maribacter sedimenticola]SNR54244.1 hypothetical protein SAMN04488009_2268 [Maribacter sedimenticola]